MSIKGQEMELALGLPIYIDCFADGKLRKCYPFTIENLFELQACLAYIDENDFMKNLQDENSVMYLSILLKKSFQYEKEEDMKDLLNNIKVNNFNELINDVKSVNGIREDNNENSKGDKTDWMVSFCSITSYTSIPFDKIKNLTLNQFYGLMEFINKKITWDYKVNTIANAKDPENHISEEDHPLVPKCKAGERKLKMEDIQGLLEV